jgi:hypothetical protein
MSAAPDAVASAAAAPAGTAPTSAALANDGLALADRRRRVFELYRDVREARNPTAAWRSWRAGRDQLFARHPHGQLAPASGCPTALAKRRPMPRIAAT